MFYPESSHLCLRINKPEKIIQKQEKKHYLFFIITSFRYTALSNYHIKTLANTILASHRFLGL